MLALVFGSWPLAARADPAARVRIAWQASAPCPDDAELVHTVERFLGQPLEETREQQLAIEARVENKPEGGYQSRLSFASPQGTMVRELEHVDCGKLTEAAALLIALAIDPERVEARQQEEASVAQQPSSPLPLPPQPEPAPSQREPSPAPKSATSPQKGPLRAQLALFGLVGGGLLPSAAPGLGAELALGVAWFEGALGGRWFASRSADVPGAPGSSIELSLSMVSLRACALPWRDDLIVRACAQGQVGMMTGSGQGVDDARTQTDAVVALGGEAAMSYRLGRVSPFLGLEAGWTAVRPRFGVATTTGELQVFRPHAWQVAGLLGVAYAL